MRKLLHFAGRAWSFVTGQIPGEHWVINKTSEVPKFLKEAAEEVSKQGNVRTKIWDIEGCYPNMPKDAIRLAMRSLLKQFEMAMQLGQKKREGVYVPKFSTTQPCVWENRRKKANMVFLPFQVMLDVMEFSLDNAMVRMPGGEVLRQVKGIPMGEPQSPGMTIATCAWMEKEWLETIEQEDRKFFRVRRFMDDILMVYADTPQWDSKRFIDDFTRSECYMEPLKLEDGKEGTFLETRFWVQGNQIRHKLKNDNEDGKQKVWRYQHWYANTPFQQKRATLTACLRKVQHQASDPAIMGSSALDKIAEFRRLRYPESVCRKACNYLAASQGMGAWITVSNALR